MAGEARSEAVDDCERASKSVVVQATGLVDALPESNDLHAPLDVDESAAVRIDVRDQQPDRVRAAVDRADALSSHC
jgi:hypothetical protein